MKKIELKSLEDLARTVREARKEQGLNQEDLAGLANTGRRFIVDLEAAKETLQIGKTLQVLSALGLSLNIERFWGED
ncbi:MAG: helix-turn-helix transcriptional regulator [Candidatus Caenarcaniphilales bacterium]|nr:helix-turn-helix transcriptional regulator [Candidatus Caenarcaniphilales bacterium]